MPGVGVGSDPTAVAGLESLDENNIDEIIKV
jgi:hypothetical protein